MVTGFRYSVTTIYSFLHIIYNFFYVQGRAPRLLLTFCRGLSTLMARAIFVHGLFANLSARGSVIYLRVHFVNVISVIHTSGKGIRFLASPGGPLISHLLVQSTVVLWFRRVIIFSGAILMFFYGTFYLFVGSARGVTQRFSHRAHQRTSRSLVMFLRHLGVRAQPMVVPFHGPSKSSLRGIHVANVIFHGRSRVMVPILTVTNLTIGPKVQHRVSLATGRQVGVYYLYHLMGFRRAVRVTVIDSHNAIRPRFFRATCVFFCFIKAVRW